MSVTYYVALPFLRTEEGVAPGEAQEMPNEAAAIRRAESMSRDPANGGAIAFKRSGDPNIGSFRRHYFESIRRGAGELGRIINVGR